MSSEATFKDLVMSLKGLIDCNHGIAECKNELVINTIKSMDNGIRGALQRQEEINSVIIDRLNMVIDALVEAEIVVKVPNIQEEINKFERGDFS